MAKKKTVKKKATSVTKRPHHPWDHHDLLLIVSGALVVIVVILVFSGSVPGLNIMSSHSKTAASENGMMENQNEKTVTIQEFSFTPEVLVVKEGTIVTWTNKDTAAHSATADDGSFDTGLLEEGESGSVTLSTAGEYTYHCSTHPNMTGKIIVEK